jgi:MarR family transcriptional regulator, organic hydroperoxide resistance regulator
LTETLPLNQQLCFALYACSKEVAKAYRDKLAPFGITYPQYLILSVLWDQDYRSVTEIGQELQLDSGTLTPMLKRLEEAGWIIRSRHKPDERRVYIELTEKGSALKHDAACSVADIWSELSLNEDTYHVLLKQLQGITKQLQKGDK